MRSTRSRARSTRSRSAAGAVAAALTVFVAACGGSVEEPAAGHTPTPPPTWEPVLQPLGGVSASGDLTTHVVGEKTLVAVEAGSAGETSLVGYRLPELQEQWRTPLDESVSYVEVLDEVHGRIIADYVVEVPCPPDAVATPCLERRVAVLDPSDGELLWRLSTWLHSATADHVIITVETEADDTNTVVGATFTGRDLDTGDDLWSHSGPGMQALPAERHTPLLPSTRWPSTWSSRPGEPVNAPASVLLQADETSLALVDLSSGDLTGLSSGREITDRAGVYVAAGLALVRYADDQSAHVAIDLGTGQQRWVLAESIAGPVADCGPVLCIGATLDDGDRTPVTYGVDRDTGQVRWTREGARHTGRVGTDGPLLSTARGSMDTESRMDGDVVEVPTHNAHVALLEPDTGEELLDLRGWKPFGADGDRLFVYRPHDVVSDLEDPDAPRSGFTRGDLRIAVVEPAGPEVVELGVIDDVVLYYGSWQQPQAWFLGCRTAYGWLTCLHDGESVSVWRYRQDAP